ncbi:MAG: hypothetical protein ACI4RC_01370 [Oscillospiraceae bacterium]
MEKFIQAFILLILSMGVVYFLYRIIDRKGNIALKITEKIPAYKKHPQVFQILIPVILVILFGVIYKFTNLQLWLLSVVTGAILGLINGFSATLAYAEKDMKK